MSNIASLEAELSRQRSINHELRSELSTISNGVNRAYDRLEKFNSKICTTLENSNSQLDDSNRKLLAAVETQAEIERLYVRFKAMELANKRIRDCNNRKFYDFANYTKVRKIVQGLMDNLDVNMASDRVIYKSIERQHLQTPDYWLTCVLLSIMAWKNDDRKLADRAMALAMDLDLKSSSVFYMLFNLRMQREDAALKWFMQYQQCELKGSDQRTFLLLFALISKSINSSEELGEQAREEIAHFIRRVVEQSIRADGYSRDEMVQKIQGHLRRFIPNEYPDYPMLRKYCKDFKKFSSVLMQAKANIPILEFLREVIHVPPEQRNTFIKSFIDEIIASANSQEKAVYEEIAYNELIIQMEGDVDKAKEIFGQQKIHDEKEMNLVYEMIEWVYGADKDDVNGQSRLNMFVLTKDLQQEAIQGHIQNYHAVDRQHAQVEINDYQSQVDFSDKQGEIVKIDHYYSGVRDAKLATIKDWPAYIGFAIGAVATVATFFTAPAMLMVTAGGVGYGAVKLLMNKSGRKHAQMQYEESYRLTEQVIDVMYTEHARLEEEYASYDAYEAEISRELDLV